MSVNVLKLFNFAHIVLQILNPTLTYTTELFTSIIKMIEFLRKQEFTIEIFNRFRYI